MYYLIYRITNNLTNKIYIGSHKTRNKADGYMGSGTYLNYAYEKHGLENFTKDILFEFDNAAAMYDKEAELVDSNFLTNENTYNLKRGGFGGWDYVNTNQLQGFKDKQHAVLCQSLSAKSIKEKYSESEISKFRSIGGHASFSMNRGIHALTPDERRTNSTAGALLAHTESANIKRKMSFDKIKHQQGSSNSQFGTCWIYNSSINCTKKIKINDIDDYLANGWAKGRRIASL